jgi:hypothetical protein
VSIEKYSQKADALLSLLSSGFKEDAKMRTSKVLGNRSTYIGMSDIGTALDCQRYALSRKIFTQSTDDLGKLLTLQRGHWLEYGISQALHAKHMKFFSQLELYTTHNEAHVKAHPDFVLVWGHPHPAVRILELKSTEHIPDTLYASYEAQLYGQIGLLRSLWNEKIFDKGKITFPELCEKSFGIFLPDDPDQVDMEAWVVCIAMSDAKAFGPYLPNKSMLDLCLNTASCLWNNLQSYSSSKMVLNALPYAQGLYPLCSFCECSMDCPKFAGGKSCPELESALVHLADLKGQKEHIGTKIADIENALKNAYHCSVKKDWITTGSYRFKVTRQVKRTLDKQFLQKRIAENIKCDADALITECEAVSKPFDRLHISKINKGE